MNQERDYHNEHAAEIERLKNELDKIRDIQRQFSADSWITLDCVIPPHEVVKRILDRVCELSEELTEARKDTIRLDGFESLINENSHRRIEISGRNRSVDSCREIQSRNRMLDWQGSTGCN